MLHLDAPTRAGWLDEAIARTDLLLLDHTHCEKKAASMAVNLIFRYGDKVELMAPLSALAREELEHFELMLGVLARRGVAFARLEPSAYGGRLHRCVRKAEPDRLLDTLLCAAMIEARSCERMQLLSEGLPDPELRELYRSLLASEARHHGTYLELAHTFFDRAAVKARLAEVSAHEAAVLAEPPGPLRMHS